MLRSTIETESPGISPGNRANGTPTQLMSIFVKSSSSSWTQHMHMELNVQDTMVYDLITPGHQRRRSSVKRIMWDVICGRYALSGLIKYSGNTQECSHAALRVRTIATTDLVQDSRSRLSPLLPAASLPPETETVHRTGGKTRLRESVGFQDTFIARDQPCPLPIRREKRERRTRSATRGRLPKRRCEAPRGASAPTRLYGSNVETRCVSPRRETPPRCLRNIRSQLGKLKFSRDCTDFPTSENYEIPKLLELIDLRCFLSFLVRRKSFRKN